VLEGLRGEESIAALCRREGIAESLYYNWSKEFLEAGKKRLAGDTARAATSDEVKVLRRETRDLKEVVAEQAFIRAENLLDRAVGQSEETLDAVRERGQPIRHRTRPLKS
jgi:transposase-like protein